MHFTVKEFREFLNNLPENIQECARKNFDLLKEIHLIHHYTLKK